MKSLKLFNLIITVVVMLFALSACETDIPSACPDLEFTLDVNGDSTEYSITADFEGIEDIIYGWYVNDNLVETEGLEEDRNNTFDFTFASGTYTICIKAESTECGGSVEFCREVTILRKREEGCPELKFEKDWIGDNKYLFKADFPGIDTIEYVWYVDGDSVESEAIGNERHHKFDYEFETGEHTVCIIAVTESCGVLEYCKDFNVEEQEEKCPEELSFVAESEGEYAYHFEANFEYKTITQYKWYIDGEEVDKENFEGTDTNHTLYWQFEPGTYTVCIKSVATDHCEAKEYCKEIVIEATCAEPSFEYEETDNGYVFIANFERKNDTRYNWFLDGEVVDEENEPGAETDHKYYAELDPGTYSICLITMETDNCVAKEYCKTITIEEPEVECVELDYTSDEVDGGYKFTADFEGRDEVTYIWKVYINDDLQGSEVREAGSEDDHEFFWQFDPGVTYEVCLKQDGCDDNTVCKEFSID